MRSDGISQAIRLRQTFGEDVVVLGLHTVFEHHEAMQPVSLRAYLHEFQVPFPVAVDRPRGNGIPATMSRLDLRGTATLLLVDKRGGLRANHFGAIDDLPLGAAVERLLHEPD